MTNQKKRISASSIKTKAQFEKAQKSDAEIIFNSPYPAAPKRRRTKKK